ncbi:hypothetical protein ACFLYV_04330 [Chloroflexota bacterium]
MKRNYYLIWVGALLVFLSALTYFTHYQIFGDTHHIFIYLIGDLGFLPLEVLIVVVVIERILAYREKRAILVKMNMAIGTYFSEIGNYLLGYMLSFFSNRDEISAIMNVQAKWTKDDFKKAIDFAFHLKTEFNITSAQLNNLKETLSGRRDFILRMLENPNLLEHDRFTDMLWALTHLVEELEARPSLENLPKADYQHICVDIQRLYDYLTSEWLDYIMHLKANYPFLYSYILRTHPFQENPSPTVT